MAASSARESHPNLRHRTIRIRTSLRTLSAATSAYRPGYLRQEKIGTLSPVWEASKDRVTQVFQVVSWKKGSDSSGASLCMSMCSRLWPKLSTSPPCRSIGKKKPRSNERGVGVSLTVRLIVAQTGREESSVSHGEPSIGERDYGATRKAHKKQTLSFEHFHRREHIKAVREQWS